MERMATLAVIHPNALFRAGLARLLSALSFGGVLEAANVQELRRQDNGCAAPDVLLINLSCGIESLDDLMRQVNTSLPEARVVFLASKLDVELLGACFAAGASGYLLETISSDALQESLKLVGTGAKVFPSELASLISELSFKLGDTSSKRIELRDCHLSAREVEILRCLAAGRSNKMIAHMLNITDTTVKVHVRRILRKIHASNRTQAALWAAARGLTAVTAAMVYGFAPYEIKTSFFWCV
jgi:two-component system, NarL family, nitrate/nitrite response regulator NarL